MVTGIIGESCTGKTTLADKLKPLLNAEVYTGKDYLRFAKNEDMAKKLFQKKLEDAVTGDHIIYVISEKEHLQLLPDGAFLVLLEADLDVIKERFARRMGGNLPAPVAAMLEKRHGCFDEEKCDLHVVYGRDDWDEVCVLIRDKVSSP